MRASRMSSVPAMSRHSRRAFAKLPPRFRAMLGILGGPRLASQMFAANGRDFSGKDGFGLDLDAPFGIQQFFDDDHSGGGTDVGEDLSVGAADLLPVLGVCDVDAGANDLLEPSAGGLKRGLDELEAGAGLVGGRGVFCADGASAGDVDDVANADGARETDDGLEGRCARDVRAVHEVDVNQLCGRSLWRAKTDRVIGEKEDDA